jgi:hypothetical protein
MTSRASPRACEPAHGLSLPSKQIHLLPTLCHPMSTEPSLSLATNGNFSGSDMGSIPTGPIIGPYAMISIRSHVPVVHELEHPNFKKWAPYFKSLVGKFGLACQPC